VRQLVRLEKEQPVKKLSAFELWSWYLTLALAAIALVLPNVGTITGIVFAIGLCWGTRFAQVQTRRQERLARRAGIR
jgi:Flp pilus assembly protein TadB